MCVQVLPNSRGSLLVPVKSEAWLLLGSFIYLQRRQRFHIQSHWHHGGGGLIVLSGGHSSPGLLWCSPMGERECREAQASRMISIFTAKGSCYWLEGVAVSTPCLTPWDNTHAGVSSHLCMALWGRRSRFPTSLCCHGCQWGHGYFSLGIVWVEWLLSKSFVWISWHFPGPLLERVMFCWDFSCSHCFWAAGSLATSLGYMREKKSRGTQPMPFFETMVSSSSVFAPHFTFLPNF